jgi:transposase InsO family protein
MSQRGNRRYNAFAESFFASEREEPIEERTCKNQELATREVSECVEPLYNRPRPHRHPGGVSP